MSGDHVSGPPKIGGIVDSGFEQGDDKQEQDQTRKEPTLVSQKAAQSSEKFVNDYINM